jgi:CRISPR-associated endonuclease/helicase Cas3
VLGSPVTEVGRDHDYDWAVVEPSSMRSLIQLAGRVRRHRASWWHLPAADALLTAVLPQQQPFRDDAIPRVALELRPNEEGDDYTLHWLMPKKGGRRGETTSVEVEKSLNKRVPDELLLGEHVSAWGHTSYMDALSELADDLELSLAECARRYGTVTLPGSQNGWQFHPALGFTKAKT